MTITPPVRSRPLVATIGRGWSTGRILQVIESRPRRIVIEPGDHAWERAFQWPDDCRAEAFGARIVTHLNGDAMGHSPGNDFEMRGGQWHTHHELGQAKWTNLIGGVWTAGCYFGRGRDVSGWRLADMTISTDAKAPEGAPFYGVGGVGISILGGCHGTVERIVVPDSATMAIAVSAHWGCDRDAGVTRHPRVVIRDVRVGRLTSEHVDTAPIALSAPELCIVEQVMCDEAQTGLLLFAGDHGYARQHPQIGGLGIVRNVIVRACNYAGIRTAGVIETPAPTYRVECARFGRGRPRFTAFIGDRASVACEGVDVA